MNFTIEGQPVGKARPRVTRTGHAYTPQKTKDYEELVRLSFKASNKGIEPSLKPIKAIIDCYYRVPSSASKKAKFEMLSNQVLPTIKPDTDNIAKAVLDALNGLAYKDDSQVVELVVTKQYAFKPRVEVEIIEKG